MVNLLPVIIVVGIISSMGIAMSYVIQFQPNLIYANAGEPIQVGPVKYIIDHIGVNNGNENTKPEHVFFQISIIAENVDTESTTISGGQFFIIDENGTQTQPVYGEFSQKDLLRSILEPKKPIEFTTQFDVPFYENKQYKLRIMPTKEQSSVDVGIICITNC